IQSVALETCQPCCGSGCMPLSPSSPKTSAEPWQNIVPPRRPQPCSAATSNSVQSVNVVTGGTMLNVSTISIAPFFSAVQRSASSSGDPSGSVQPGPGSIIVGTIVLLSPQHHSAPAVSVAHVM